MNKFCTNCGKENDNNAKFCQHCGSQFKNLKTDNLKLNNSLCDATLFGNTSEVKELLLQGADINYKNERSLSSLHLAAFKNNIELVKLLLEEGANVNIQDKYNSTPLISATIEGHLDIVDELLEFNCDIYMKDDENRTALQIALEIEYGDNNQRRFSICTALVNKCDTTVWKDWLDEAEYALIHASDNNNIDVVKKLISAGMFLNFQDWDSNNETAILKAIRNKHTEVALLLIKSGANVEIEESSHYKFSAVSWAKMTDNKVILQELSSLGIDLSKAKIF